ncbi:hypothetical protein DH2020_009658 [Rehmannia glutinosa]|uniref:WEB family protein n=1 Tax=Rehmannia glutinosa TaxID=99300 RepID=A0ABR0X9M2_REHGL
MDKFTLRTAFFNTRVEVRTPVSGTPNAKPSPATTTRVRKSSKGVAKPSADSTSSSLQNARLSADQSPGSVTSKPILDKPSPKLITATDKKATRLSKPLDLQAELDQAQEDLKKANEKLVVVAKQKAKAVKKVNEAHKLSEETNKKLREALDAQKRAEDNSEIEKFRAVELERAGIEAAQIKDEKWQKEIESVRNEHALDLAALLSTNQELQKVKQELMMSCDAKNQALSHADMATKIAEIHAEKAKSLSAELAIENDKLVSELELEIEKAKFCEEKLVEKEAVLEKVSVDLDTAKMAEFYAGNLVKELHEKAEELKFQSEELKKSEKSKSESLELVMKQLEKNHGLLHDAKSQIPILKKNVDSMEISSKRLKEDLAESERRVEQAKEEAYEMVKKFEFLESELETVKEEKTWASKNEKLAADSVQTLSEEKTKLVNELETVKDEEKKSKKALESLASALHEVSSEARDAKEKLFSIQVENEMHKTQINDLRVVLKETSEKYESILDDAKHEIDALTNSIEQSKHDYCNLKAELEETELRLMNSVKKSEQENSGMEVEISRLVNLIKAAEEEACATRENEARWKNSFQEANSEVIHLKKVIGEAKAEKVRLKEGSINRENETRKINVENEELRKREVASLIKVEVLSNLLEETLANKKQQEENGELTDCEKDYDVLKWTSFMSVNEKPTEDDDEFVQNSNGNKLKEGEEGEREISDSLEVDLKMWESCKIDEKDFSIEGVREEESFEDSKVEDGGSCTENVDNGGSSPLKLQNEKKKKNALLGKIGSLLKKGNSNLK